jgi:hypothetical protein
MNELESSFLIASLLHDCAHTPFSHTFEHYYQRPDKRFLEERLKLLMDDEDVVKSFKDDYDNVGFLAPKPHELASAIIAMEEFGEAIRKNGGNKFLVARMIIGCVYRGHERDELGVKNCLIELLNSETIDIDKLDYTMRDTWASGANVGSIDIYRLLAAIKIHDDKCKLRIAFKSSAMSAIENVKNSRTFFKKYFFYHHTVQYDQYLLQNSVNCLNSLLSKDAEPENHDQFFEEFFNIRRLTEKFRTKKYSVYLPTDGDLLYLLKLCYEEIPHVQEWLSRKYTMKPLWKTTVEYLRYFGEFPRGLKRFCKNHIKNIMEENGFNMNNFLITDFEFNENICFHNVAVEVDGILLPFEQIPSKPEVSEVSEDNLNIIDPQDLTFFFYIFYSYDESAKNEEKDQRASLINNLIKLLKDSYRPE